MAPRKTPPKPPTVDTTTALAEHLGLSRWTVSRALNGRGGVGEDTRRKVQEAMASLGFQPNVMARGLRGARTGLIGVCFQELESVALVRKVSLLQSLLRERGLRTVIELTNGEAALEAQAIGHFLAMKVEGIVLVGSSFAPGEAILKRLRGAGFPIVAVDPGQALPIPSVSLDRRRAMHLKLEHLHQLGHRRFALLGINSDAVYGGLRREALREAARRLRLDPDQDLHFLQLEGYHLQSYDYGQALARVLLAQRQAPRALICLNDRIALGALRALQEAGKRVPEDYSLVGFDNLEVGAWTRPALTSVDQQVERIMPVALELLQQCIAGPGSTKVAAHLIEPQLVIRDSTGRA